MNKLWALVEALYKGKELQNKETWKNSAMLLMIFTSIIKAVDVFIPEIEINDYQLNTIANGLVQVGLLFGAYTTAATSASVGVKPRNK